MVDYLGTTRKKLFKFNLKVRMKKRLLILPPIFSRLSLILYVEFIKNLCKYQKLIDCHICVENILRLTSFEQMFAVSIFAKTSTEEKPVKRLLEEGQIFKKKSGSAYIVASVARIEVEATKRRDYPSEINYFLRWA